VEKCRDRRPRRANVLEFKGGNVVKLNGKGSVVYCVPSARSAANLE
jgi:hypothetical protein